MPFQTYSAWAKLPGCRATAPTDYSHYPLQATPVGLTPVGFGLAPVRSPLLRGSLLLSFPRVTKMFQFTRLPPSALFCSGGGDAALPAPGCPIRESPGSSLLAANRSNFVACHARHRLSVPRHPSRTVGSLTTQYPSAHCKRLYLSYAVVKVHWLRQLLISY